MSSFINTKYNNTGGVQNFIMTEIQASARLKEVDEFIVHQMLNKLHTFDQLKVTYNVQKDKRNVDELISLCFSKN